MIATCDLTDFVYQANGLFIYRELAYQIAEQFRVFGSHIGLKDVVVVGGIGGFEHVFPSKQSTLRPHTCNPTTSVVSFWCCH